MDVCLLPGWPPTSVEFPRILIALFGMERSRSLATQTILRLVPHNGLGNRQLEIEQMEGFKHVTRARHGYHER